MRHFELEQNDDREECVFIFVRRVHSATVVETWAEWPQKKFRDQEEFVRS